jgi:hypothetical protein
MNPVKLMEKIRRIEALIPLYKTKAVTLVASKNVTLKKMLSSSHLIIRNFSSGVW